jgi:SAM-dependent methyltransferase
MSEADPYLLGYRRIEQERLERQADELAADSERLFDEIGVGEGWRVIEIGCGPRGALALLSKRVGATGRVVGVERSAEQVGRARRHAADNGLENVEVVEADGRATGLRDGSFDLATARLVFANVPRPEEILAEMVRLVRPGGIVALHEPDATTQRTEPPFKEQQYLLGLLNDYARTNGIDRSIGLRAPRMLREHGLADVHVHPIVHAYPPGHSRRMLLPEFVENARERLLADGLIPAADLDALVGSLRRQLEKPETLVVSSLFIQAWGRKASM